MITLDIVPFGPVPPEVIGAVARTLGDTLGVDPVFRQERPVPLRAWDAARGQFNSEVLLRALVAESESAHSRILGVTAVDLFIPMLSFVFGQAQLNGTAAVVSVARLDPGFYGLPPRPELLSERVVREALHEVGHTLGLTHCSSRTCPMSLATSVDVIDLKSKDLCPGCGALARERRRHLESLSAGRLS